MGRGGDLETALRPRLEPTGECPACDSQRRSEGYALGVLIEHLGEEGELTRLFRDSSGLCLPHLRVALAARDHEAGLATLLDIQRRRLEELYGELEEYLRKHDYRFSHEPYGPEEDAHVRATEFLAGLWWDLPGRGPAEPGDRGAGRREASGEGGNADGGAGAQDAEAEGRRRARGDGS